MIDLHLDGVAHELADNVHSHPGQSFELGSIALRGREFLRHPPAHSGSRCARTQRAHSAEVLPEFLDAERHSGSR